MMVEPDDETHNQDNEPAKCRVSTEAIFELKQNTANLSYHTGPPEV
jgi:hypothetical protein